MTQSFLGGFVQPKTRLSPRDGASDYARCLKRRPLSVLEQAEELRANRRTRLKSQSPTVFRTPHTSIGEGMRRM